MEKNKKDLKKDRDRKRCNAIKELLEVHGINLQLIDEYKKDINEQKEKATCIRSSLSNASPLKGAVIAKDDMLIKALDKVKDLESELKATKEEVQKIKKAIKSIDDSLAKSIIMRVWVYRSDSLRALANEFKISKDTVWRKSDVALLSLYKKLIK